VYKRQVFNYLPDEKIAIVAGSPYHIKLTYQEDIQLMEEYMRKKKINDYEQ